MPLDFGSIHNYYEPLVIQHILAQVADEEGVEDENLLADIACVALNQLPARYVRHDIDTAFYLTDAEHEAMETAVTEAVAQAREQVRARNRERQTGTAS